MYGTWCILEGLIQVRFYVCTRISNVILVSQGAATDDAAWLGAEDRGGGPIYRFKLAAVSEPKYRYLLA